MMFDNAPVPPRSRRETLHRSAPMVLLVVSAVGVAAGLHLASAAVAVVAAGHLVVVGLFVAARRVGATRSNGRQR